MRLLSVLWIAAMLFACSPQRAHIPMPQPTPLFQESGDFYLSASHQFERGFHFQGGAAAFDKYALIAAATYGQQDNCFSCSKEVARHLEIGVGLFQRRPGDFTREIFIGGGLGRLKLINTEGWDPSDDEITVLSSHYSHGFLQGDIGWDGKFADRIVSARASVFRFSDVSRWNGAGTPLAVPERYWAVFLDPAVTLRLGYKQFKVESQAGLSIPVMQEKPFDNQKIWVSFGLSFRKFHPK